MIAIQTFHQETIPIRTYRPIALSFRLRYDHSINVLVGGDFNCGDIEWSAVQVIPGVQIRATQLQLLDITSEYCLSQVVNITTREDKVLHLLLTDCSGSASRVKGIPPIAKSDHDIVYIEYDIKV